MNLFEEICSCSNLLSAFDRVEENAGGPGVDNVTIEEFSLSRNETLMFRDVLCTMKTVTGDVVIYDHSPY